MILVSSRQTIRKVTNVIIAPIVIKLGHIFSSPGFRVLNCCKIRKGEMSQSYQMLGIYYSRPCNQAGNYSIISFLLWVGLRPCMPLSVILLDYEPTYNKETNCTGCPPSYLTCTFFVTRCVYYAICLCSYLTCTFFVKQCVYCAICSCYLTLSKLSNYGDSYWSTGTFLTPGHLQPSQRKSRPVGVITMTSQWGRLRLKSPA